MGISCLFYFLDRTAAKSAAVAAGRVDQRKDRFIIRLGDFRLDGEAAVWPSVMVEEGLVFAKWPNRPNLATLRELGQVRWPSWEFGMELVAGGSGGTRTVLVAVGGGVRFVVVGGKLDVGFLGFPAFPLSRVVALLGKAGGKPAAKLARGCEKGLVFATCPMAKIFSHWA